jgi:putative intracellular protease/amidase
MKRSALRTFAFVLFALVLPVTVAHTAVFKCPPCGAACDDTTFTAAGACPACGMELIAEGTTPRCAILIFEGVQIIDYTGPYEVFGQANFEVYTVAATAEPITTVMGMRVIPNYTIANAPPADVIVVPGGAVEAATGNPAVLDWVRAASADADQVLSVCNGAFILSAAGLLDGLRATTFYGLLDALENTATRTTIVRDKRFVDNGKFITSAGLSSGIDASLHVIERRLGRGRAQSIAVHLEYDWNPAPDAGFARGALALVQLEDAPNLFQDLPATLVSTAGDRERWRIERDVTTDLAAAALQERFAAALAAQARWKRATHTKSGTAESLWLRPAENGGHWRWRITVAPAATGTLRATFDVEHAEAPMPAG